MKDIDTRELESQIKKGMNEFIEDKNFSESNFKKGKSEKFLPDVNNKIIDYCNKWLEDASEKIANMELPDEQKNQIAGILKEKITVTDKSGYLNITKLCKERIDRLKKCNK